MFQHVQHLINNTLRFFGVFVGTPFQHVQHLAINSLSGLLEQLNAFSKKCKIPEHFNFRFNFQAIRKNWLKLEKYKNSFFLTKMLR